MAEVMAVSMDELHPSSSSTPQNTDQDSFSSDDSRTLPSEPEPEPERPLLAAVPKGVDPTKFKLAYGRRAIPKLISELSDDRLLYRQRALLFLSDLLKNPENVAAAIQGDIVKMLTRLLQDTDLTIRQKTTECLLTISSESAGRITIVRQGSFLYLGKLFDDSDPLIRRNTHEVLARTTLAFQGVESLMSYSMLPTLVMKLPKERYDIQIQILETLHNCIRLGKEPLNPGDALRSNALEELTLLIQKSPVTDIKVAASKCIMVLTFFPEAKKLACKGHTIVALIRLLGDGKAAVRAAAAGALMSISIEVEGKKILVKENAMGKLMTLLDDKDPSVLLNVIKTITNCAEDYRGRFQLNACLLRMEEVKDAAMNAQISQAAEIALATIQWRP